MIINFFFFWSFFCSTIVIFCNNVLYSILGLIGVIVGSCSILFFLKIEFLSFILLLIYIGAILILFLFIVMMLELNVGELEKKESFSFSVQTMLFAILGVKIFSFLYFFNKKICISLELVSDEFIKAEESIGYFSNLFSLTGNDAALFFKFVCSKILLFYCRWFNNIICYGWIYSIMCKK